MRTVKNAGALQQGDLVSVVEKKNKKITGFNAEYYKGIDWRIMGLLAGFVVVLTVVFYHGIDSILRLAINRRREAERKMDIVRLRVYEQAEKN